MPRSSAAQVRATDLAFLEKCLGRLPIVRWIHGDWRWVPVHLVTLNILNTSINMFGEGAESGNMTPGSGASARGQKDTKGCKVRASVTTRASRAAVENANAGVGLLREVSVKGLGFSG